MKTEEASIFLLLLVMFTATERTWIERKKQCKEQMIHNQKALNCSHQNLPYIPKTENNVTYLIFSYNDLRNVSSETFENVSNPDSLTDLFLDHNNIQNISKTALSAFQNLKYLYLSYNPIYYENMKNLLGELSKLKFLSHLGMSGIATITIQRDLFSLVKENQIKLLEIRFYNMRTLWMDTFGRFDSLEVFYLSDNHVENIKLSKKKHLHNLYLDFNKFKSFPDFSVDGSEKDCYLPNLELLSVKGNDITEIGFDNFKCLLKLKTLQLDRNPIKVLQNNFLLKLPKLELLRLRFLHADRLTVEPLAFKSSSLRCLQLRFDSPAKDLFISFNDTFRVVPNLRNLSLGLISLQQLTNQQFSSLFSPLDKIRFFECFGCQISQDPKVILTHFKHVVYLNLHSSQVTRLTDETFKENKHLRYLDLRYNDIAHIQESALPISLLNNLHSLDLSQNPFVCDCDLEWLINWMKTKQYKKVIRRYPQQYICSLPTEKSKLLLSEVSFTYKECHPWSSWIWAAIIALPCVIVIGITVLILYRNRWNIKHYIYLLRKRRNYQIIDGHNFVYDAFIGYEVTDSAWVRRRLLPVLEEEVGLKLCIHERDFQPGAFINDNIVTNMDKSAKVVLVLTNAFARSGWCMFELKIAHSKLIEDETELVIILLEKVDGINMNHSLKVLFDTTTYIEWTEDVVGQELFWTKLKNVLKK
ncbi:toll-like receptor 13 isoform X1 [Mercenaria mercenaria]|uniref:toll-like receptor 13 isoform X1 n=1 Tax=Mercenaria mercenaria TaxID=6596 RepID=UPI00234EE3E8|nr:toll-like receptor 13 isoform X1 [Mercenaria mercenaria]